MKGEAVLIKSSSARWQRGFNGMVAVGAAALICAALPAGGAAGNLIPDPAGPLLPDLDQQTPSALMVARTRTAGGRSGYALGFQSAVRNIGQGALIIVGHRADTRTPTMTAEQLVDHGDGGQSTTPTTSRLRYAVSRGHQHWHLLRFDRYELRRAGSAAAVVRDRKSGFCLGDRYRVTALVVPATMPDPRYTDRCGLSHPQRLTVLEGISPGYGDNYLPYLEGQSLPLTGLRPGRYVLVHRVNEDKSLLESDYGNNAASVLLDLRWRRGRPVLRVLASCPDTDICGR
jgi:hypothetical protein